MEDRNRHKTFIRQKQLIPHMVPFSPATLWRKVRSGGFPKPIKLSENITAWRYEEVQAWIEAQK
jgi:predicted DNA-binding transcriptional regulator AlpA